MRKPAAPAAAVVLLILGGGAASEAADGTIAAWGSNDCRQCSVPPANQDFCAVAEGPVHSLGLRNASACTPLEEAPESPPSGTALSASPNPFSNIVTLSVSIDESGPVAIEAFDATGRLLERGSVGHLQTGRRSLQWCGSLSDGTPLPSGVCIFRVVCPCGRSSVARLVLAR